MKRLILAVVAVAAVSVVAAHAEYGDIVLNERSGQAGQRPVIFPHWVHRSAFTCRVCHTELGFKMQAGGNNISMGDVYYGRYCGECHNGEVAFGIEANCGRCHSGKEGTPTGVHGRHRTTGPGYW